MVNVTVTAYQDTVGTYPSGCDKSVSGASTVLGTDKVLMYPLLAGCQGDDDSYMTLLHIADPILGELWIDETEESFADKIAAAAGGPAGGGGLYINSIIGNAGQPPAGLTVTYTSLIGATLDALSVRGVVQDVTGRLNNATGTINLTDLGGVAVTDLVTAEYHY